MVPAAMLEKAVWTLGQAELALLLLVDTRSEFANSYMNGELRDIRRAIAASNKAIAKAKEPPK